MQITDIFCFIFTSIAKSTDAYSCPGWTKLNVHVEVDDATAARSLSLRSHSGIFLKRKKNHAGGGGVDHASPWPIYFMSCTMLSWNLAMKLLWN